MFQRVREGRSLLTGRTLASIVCVAALLIGGIRNAQAETVITGTVFGQEYLLTGSPVNVSTHAVLKITFGVTTAGENLALCAGSVQDFEARRCSTPLKAGPVVSGKIGDRREGSRL